MPALTLVWDSELQKKYGDVICEFWSFFAKSDTGLQQKAASRLIIGVAC